MSRRSARRGFTLREMFAVIAIIGVVLAVCVPAIQSARERARRVQCTDNLKWIALGFHQYHAAYQAFPAGAIYAGPNPGGDQPVTATLGPSWFYRLLPGLEYDYDSVYSTWYCGIEKTQSLGGPVNRQFCATDMMAAGVPLNQCGHGHMRCPSSPLPLMETPTGPIVLPSYVGIAGGCDIDPDSQDYKTSGSAVPGLVAPQTVRVYHNKFKGTGATAGGIVTSSGMLPPCQHVRLADCTDGTFNTMIIAEQSGWLLDRNPASSKKCHGDPGWTVGGTGPGGGWLSGTRRVDPVPEVDTPGGPPATWGADCWNITTVRYPPNLKRVMGTPSLPGCSENHGTNNPLQSPHPGGFQAAFADGSVMFISDKTALEVLLRLAIRNDGQPVGDNE